MAALEHAFRLWTVTSPPGAFAREPAVVGRSGAVFAAHLHDEPTIGFDPSARRDAWVVVRRLTSGGTTGPRAVVASGRGSDRDRATGEAGGTAGFARSRACELSRRSLVPSSPDRLLVPGRTATGLRLRSRIGGDVDHRVVGARRQVRPRRRAAPRGGRDRLARGGRSGSGGRVRCRPSGHSGSRRSDAPVAVRSERHEYGGNVARPWSMRWSGPASIR